MSVKRLDAKLDQKKIAKQHVATYTTADTVPFLSDLQLTGFRAETESDLGLFVAMRDGMIAMKTPIVLFVRSGVKVQADIGVTVVRDGDTHYSEMWRACDMAFCLSQEAVEEALDAMVVPLAPKKMSHIQNYDPNREKGNAFVFEKLSPWLMFAAMVRACETYRFPFDWKCIVRSRI